MALVILDASAFSLDWFKAALPELIDSRNVKFAYASLEKYKLEISKCRDLAKVLREMRDTGRRLDIDAEECRKHSAFLASHVDWKKNACCDDEHIFSMIYTKPAAFVFSADARMAQCRVKMNKVIDKRYCDFVVLSSLKAFNHHKAKVLAA